MITKNKKTKFQKKKLLDSSIDTIFSASDTFLFLVFFIFDMVVYMG